MYLSVLEMSWSNVNPETGTRKSNVPRTTFDEHAAMGDIMPFCLTPCCTLWLHNCSAYDVAMDVSYS